MLKIRTILLSVVLVIILMLTVQLVTARTEVISDPSSKPAVVIQNQQLPVNQNNVPVLSYRSPLDECFDVSLRELANCHNASQASALSSYRSPLDECFDVPLREAATCRNTSSAPAP